MEASNALGLSAAGGCRVSDPNGVRTESGRKLDKLYTDFYYGGGKDNPSMTTRMALMEDIVTKINKNLAKIVWLALATALAVVVDIFVKR
jgi:hypothetical protein